MLRSDDVTPRAYKQVDVFTRTPLQGNPVAVVLEAEGLSTAQMLALARWTNLSETTFVLKPTHPAADYKVRIFTTEKSCPSPATQRWAPPTPCWKPDWRPNGPDGDAGMRRRAGGGQYPAGRHIGVRRARS